MYFCQRKKNRMVLCWLFQFLTLPRKICAVYANTQANTHTHSVNTILHVYFVYYIDNLQVQSCRQRTRYLTSTHTRTHAHTHLLI